MKEKYEERDWVPVSHSPNETAVFHTNILWVCTYPVQASSFGAWTLILVEGSRRAWGST